MGARLREVCRVAAAGGGGAGDGGAVQWSGAALALVSERGVELTELQGAGGGHERGLQARGWLLPCARAAPHASAARRLRAPAAPAASNLQAAALAAESALWGLEARRAARLARVRSHARAPAAFLCSNDNPVAVLTNHGAVSLFARRRLGWAVALDLSALVYQNYEQRWSVAATTELGRARERCCDLQSSSVCWGAPTAPDGCLIVLSQRSEVILFMEVQVENEPCKLSAEIRQEWSTDIGEIGSMVWIPREDGSFLLICSGVSGLIKSYIGKIENNDILLQNSISLWTCEDQMIVDSVVWYRQGDDIVVVFAKNRYLLVFVINPRNEVIQQCVNNVNDFKIICLTKLNNEDLYVVTSDSSIYKLSILIKDNIEFKLSKVDIREDFSDYIIHGMTFSPNGAFLVISALRKRCALKRKSFIELIFLRFEDFDPIEALLNNPTQNLTSMWDCIELLRLQCRKNQSIFKNNYDAIFSDPNLSTYYMKVYLILWTLHKKLESTYLKVETESIFHSLPSETIRDTILVRHAVCMVDTLYRDHKIYQQLSEFERQIYVGCYTYLKQYCRKYKYDVSTYVDDDVLRFAETEVGDFSNYKCCYCDEMLSYYLCRTGHPNQFCVVTFQQILGGDYLVCKVCGATACTELYPQKPKCTICDVYLDKYLER